MDNLIYLFWLQINCLPTNKNNEIYSPLPTKEKAVNLKPIFCTDHPKRVDPEISTMQRGKEEKQDPNYFTHCSSYIIIFVYLSFQHFLDSELHIFNSFLSPFHSLTLKVDTHTFYISEFTCFKDAQSQLSYNFLLLKKSCIQSGRLLFLTKTVPMQF